MRFLILGWLMVSPPAFADSRKIMASFSILADITRNLVPNDLKVDSLLDVDMDSHGYQTTARDYFSMKRAHLILFVGQNFEPWATKILKHWSLSEIYYVTKNLVLLPRDPHFWQSPESTLQMIFNLSQELIRIYPEYKKSITQKTTAYSQKIKDLQNKCRLEIESVPLSKRKMVVAHNSFQYFAQEFKVEILSPSLTNSDENISLPVLAQLIQKIRTESIKALFYEKSSSKQMMDRISQEVSGTIAGTLYSDSLSRNNEASTYLKMLEYNCHMISQSMKGAPR